MSRLLALATLLLTLPVIAQQDPVMTTADVINPHQALLAKAEALVTVRFVLKVKVNGGDNDDEGEITCQLIDPQGLVLCSNTELGGYITQMGRLMGASFRGYSVSAAPSDLEVIVGDGIEGVEASLLARDTERDLAWIRMERPEDAPALPFLDFDDSAVVGPGDKLYTLRRLDKFFGSVPMVTEVTVGALLKKPRKLYAQSPPRNLGFGLPAFTSDGKLVGLTVLQLAGADDDAANRFGGPVGMVGASQAVSDMLGGLILPAEDVVRATRLALETFGGEAVESGAAED